MGCIWQQYCPPKMSGGIIFVVPAECVQNSLAAFAAKGGRSVKMWLNWCFDHPLMASVNKLLFHKIKHFKHTVKARRKKV